VHYTQAMEKENQYLRLEVEKSKYSKDKEGYSKFIQGLIKHRGTAPTSTTESTSLTRRREEPLQELQISKVNTSSNNSRPQQIQMSESQEQLLLKSALRKAGVVALDSLNSSALHETRKSVDFTDLKGRATIDSAEPNLNRKQTNTFTPKSIEQP